tara:strand:+ start:2922 stop:5087 length:2166 start_codon:yes stop_codon:yes gene_type:complete
MAKELTSGERQVFTTPSSLASRMGVVKANAGDPVELATSELGKTLEFIAKRKSIQAEEKWKADVKVSSLEKISKMSQDYRYSPSDFINNATGFRDGLLESSPKAFRDWTRTYLAQIITSYSNQIIDATWKRDQKELLLKNTESNKSEMSDMDSILLQAPWQDHTKLFEEQFSARLQEMVDSYTAVYNSIPTAERTGMPTPDEQSKMWKTELEQSRNLSIAQKMIHDAVEIDKQRIAEGILVGDEINGWVGPSAVDDALSLLNEMMLGYEMKGIVGRKEIFEKNNTAAPGGMDGPWSFIDLDQVERMTIKTNTIIHANNLVKQYKTESAALTNHQQTVLSNNIELATSGGQGAINDTFSLLDKESDVKHFVDTSLVGADQTQIDSVYDSWRTAKKIVSLFPQMLEKGATFDSNIHSIMTELKQDGIIANKKEVELALANHYVGHFLLESTGSPYLDVTKVGFIEDGSPTNELIAVGQFSKKFMKIHPSLHTILASAGSIDIEENENAILSLANVVGYLQDQSALIPRDAKYEVWQPLLQLHRDLQYLGASQQGKLPTAMNKKHLLEMYKMKVNPDSTDLDEKLERINRAINADITWSKSIDDSDSTVTSFDQNIQEKLYEIIGKHWKSGLMWDNLWLSKIKEGLGWLDRPLKDMIPSSSKDLNFYMQDIFPLYKQLVIAHLAQSYGKASHILPSNIDKYLEDAIQGATNELGNQGFVFEAAP